jgi:hypothetical protein
LVALGGQSNRRSIGPTTPGEPVANYRTGEEASGIIYRDYSGGASGLTKDYRSISSNYRTTGHINYRTTG